MRESLDLVGYPLRHSNPACVAVSTLAVEGFHRVPPSPEGATSPTTKFVIGGLVADLDAAPTSCCSPVTASPLCQDSRRSITRSSPARYDAPSAAPRRARSARRARNFSQSEIRPLYLQERAEIHWDSAELSGS
jgi:hypothetical protein